MKIAVVNVVAFPNTSTGKFMTQYVSYYEKHDYDCRVYYGRGKKVHSANFYKFNSFFGACIHYLFAKITKKEGYYSKLQTKRLIKKLKEYSPDVIQLFNLHGHYVNIPMLMNYCAESSAIIAMAMCDEYSYTAQCAYTFGCNDYMSGCKKCCEANKNYQLMYDDKLKYYSAIKENKLLFFSAKYIVDNAKQSALLAKKRFKIINPGIDTTFYSPRDTKKLKEELNINDEQICILDVAPYSNERKGVKYFFELAKLMEYDTRFVFINVGFDGDKNVVPSNMRAISYVSNQDELAEFYSIADLFICTSTADAMPNACLEAMSCGTPILAFDCSGMPYIAKEPILHLVPPGDVKAMADFLCNIKIKNGESIKECREYAIRNFDFDVCTKELLYVINEMI